MCSYRIASHVRIPIDIDIYAAKLNSALLSLVHRNDIYMTASGNSQVFPASRENRDNVAALP